MGPPSTETLTALASAQHGAVAISQLGDTDVTRRWVANLVRRGVLVRACPGVVLIAGSAPSWHRDLMVGLLALGESSWVSHEGAARLHGLDRTPDAPVEFTALREARGRALRFTVHTTNAMPKIDRVEVGDIRATSATRTILDLARARVSRDRLAAAMDSAIRLGLTAPAALRTRLAARRGPGHWGAPVLDELLADAGGHSMLERRFLELTRRAGFPRPNTQVIHRRDGRTFRGSTSSSRPTAWSSRSPADSATRRRPSGPGTRNGATSCRTSAARSSSTPGRTSHADQNSWSARSRSACTPLDGAADRFGHGNPLTSASSMTEADALRVRRSRSG